MKRSMMKVVGKVVTALLIIVLAGLGLVYFLPGYDMYLVRSESMAPAINMGDLIITGPVGEEVNEGEIITFKWSNDLITHRVYSVGETVIRTKGDAVEDPDPWTIQTSDIKGKYLFKVPFIGFATRFIQTKVGWFVTIIIPAMVLVIWLAKDIVKEALKSDAKSKP